MKWNNMHGKYYVDKKEAEERIEQLETALKFVLSFVDIDIPEPGYDPTFYFSCSYETDCVIWEKLQEIRKSIGDKKDG